MNRRGILLVFVSGFLVILSLAGVMLLNLGRFAQAGSGPNVSAVQSRLAAESGMHYARSRLGGIVLPDGRLAETRGDDWTFREGFTAGLQGALNPSFSHGEGWTESGGEPGVFDQNADDLSGWTDRDGDGRFSAWSGRLKGGAAFSLKIVSPEGKIPVNAGALNASDVHGPGMPVGPPGNGRPDHSDPEIPYHRGGMHVLNNLGVIQLPAGLHRWETPESAPGCEIFEWSSLGDDVLKLRPPGGYRSMDDLKARLLSYGYTLDEWKNVEPFLDVGPYVGCGFDESGRAVGYEGGSLPRYVPVNLWGAPVEVLEALWTKLAVPLAKSELPGEVAGWEAPCSRAGKALPFRKLGPNSHGLGGSPEILMSQIYPEEAQEAARVLDALRRDRKISWGSLQRTFRDQAPELFKIDYGDLKDAAPGLAATWCRIKAEILFQAVSADPRPLSLQPEARAVPSGTGWEIRGGDVSGKSVSAITRLWPSPGPEEVYPFEYGFEGTPLEDQVFFPFEYFETRNNGGAVLQPQGGTLAPPVRFSVGSLGRSLASTGHALAAGEILAAERLEFTSQEDFENLGKGQNLARRGISAVDPDPFKRRDVRDDATLYEGGGKRRYPHVVTLPKRGLFSSATPVERNSPWWGYARGTGSISLAGREGGLQEARLYWAIKEDADRVMSNNNVYTPGPQGEFWHEQATALPPANPLSLGSIMPFEIDWNPFTVDFLSKFDSRRNTFNWVFQCPGMTGVPGVDLLQAFSMEAWMRPGSAMAVVANHPPGVPLTANPAPLVRVEVLRDRALSRTEIRLDVSGYEAPAAQPFASTASFLIDDSDLAPWAPWNLHVVVTAERVWDPGAGAFATDFLLYVNGLHAFGSGQPLAHRHPRSIQVQDKEGVEFKHLDEIRLCDIALGRDAAEAHFRMGRFVDQGEFVSPLYVFDEKTRLMGAQWTGLVPSSLPDPQKAIAVSVMGYADDAGTLSEKSLSLEGSEETTDLSGLGSARSFRYKVVLDADAADVVIESPVFDSIWFLFKRAGRSAIWTAWR